MVLGLESSSSTIPLHLPTLPTTEIQAVPFMGYIWGKKTILENNPFFHALTLHVLHQRAAEGTGSRYPQRENVVSSEQTNGAMDCCLSG